MSGFPGKQPVNVTGTLNVRLRPLRHTDIEDAFDRAMKQHGHGARVTGGGTSLTPQGEISACHIEIELDDLSDALIMAVTGTLTALQMPKGSYLTVPPGRRIDFGVREGLALYLDGTDLRDADHVFAECARLLGDAGSVDSHWTGKQETALYMYGADFRIMMDRLQEYPLCRKCRIEQIA